MLKRRQLRHFGWPILSVPYFTFLPDALSGGGMGLDSAYKSLNLRAGLDALVHPLHRAYRTTFGIGQEAV